MNQSHQENLDDVEYMADLPPLPRLPVEETAGPHLDALPITEYMCRVVCAETGCPFDFLSRAPMSKGRLRAHLERQILPAIKRHLAFMGVAALPRIQVVGDGFPLPHGVSLIRYPAYVHPDGLSDDEFTDWLDISLTNAAEGELPGTIGQVPIDLASALFCNTLAMVDASTTAHRRYKNKFSGAQIHLIFHLDYNHAEVFFPEDLLVALNDGAQCYLRGR